MFKVLVWARRREDLTPQAFRDYWLGTHAPLVKSSYEGLRRYIVHPAVGAPRGEPLFDGIAEMVFDSRDAFVAAARSDGGRAAAADLTSFTRESGAIFVEEHAIVG
ncbi:MAG: EthD family reductase [Armatimonadota bacterium]